MKRKKLLAFFLSLTLLTGCGGPSLAQRTDVNVKDIPSLTIYNPNSFTIYDSTTKKSSVDSAALLDWESYMSKVYHTSVVLKTQNPDMTQASGIAYLPMQTIINLQKSGSILPLNDYLKNNTAWNSLPDSVKNQYESNGQIWAIPTSVAHSMPVTLINNQWLNKVNMPVPQSLTDLYNVGAAFQKDDANGDGKANDYLFGGGDGINGMAADVLSSYGLAPKVLGYSAKYDEIIDSFFDPQAVDAMNYLHSLYTGKMVYPLSLLNQADMDAMPQNMVLTNFGTINTSLSKVSSAVLSAELANDTSLQGKTAQTLTDADIQKITSAYSFLPPLSTSNPTVDVEAAPNAYVLLKSTPKPSETINLFVDMMFATTTNYLECSLGLSKNYTMQSNNTLMLHYKDDSSQTLPATPNLVPYSNGILIDSNFTVLYPGQTVSSSQELANAFQKQIDDYFTKYTASGQIKVMSPFAITFTSKTLSAESSSVNRTISTALISCIRGNRIAGDASGVISNYKSDMINLNSIQQVLTEANQSIGKNLTEIIQP